MSCATSTFRLHVSGNPLIQVPDFSTLLPDLVILELNNINFTCCWKIAFLKKMSAAVLSIDDTPCKYPSEFVNVTWVDVTETQMWGDPCGD